MSNGLNITIRYDDTDLQRLMSQSPRRINAVARKLANIVSRDLHKSLGTSIPTKAGTSVAGFRRVRAKRKNTLVKKNRYHASVWLGGNRIAARYGGRLRNGNGGAFAGRHFFAGSFIATMKSGYRSIFHKTKNGKFVQDTIAVPDIHAESVRTIRFKRAGWENLLRIELDRILK